MIKDPIFTIFDNQSPAHDKKRDSTTAVFITVVVSTVSVQKYYVSSLIIFHHQTLRAWTKPRGHILRTLIGVPESQRIFSMR